MEMLSNALKTLQYGQNIYVSFIVRI